MTLLEWLLGMILTAVGAAVVTMVRADLEDAKVCRWLARQLIFRAANRLPEDERARWREECIADLLQMEGRTAPLLWALSTWAGAGRWGRMLGAPSRWQVLIARVRARWEELRSRPNAPTQPTLPPEETTQVLQVGVDAVLVNPLTVTGGGSVEVKLPNTPWWCRAPGAGLPRAGRAPRLDRRPGLLRQRRVRRLQPATSRLPAAPR